MEARDLRTLSGPWSGFWIQDLVRGYMKLKLHFVGTNLNGGGNDAIGSFEVAGIFSDETGQVLFTVTYRTHTVDYSGTWDGQFIFGKWTLHDESFSEIGEFEMWPDKEETDPMSGIESLEDSLALPGVPAG